MEQVNQESPKSFISPKQESRGGGVPSNPASLFAGEHFGSSGGGGRRKQSRDNHVITCLLTPKNLACIHNCSSLHAHIQVDIHVSIYQDMHSHPKIYVYRIYMKIRMQTNHDKPLHKHTRTHTHASANLQMRRCPQLAKFCTNCSLNCTFP